MPAGPERLSDRELQVLRCLGRGLATLEVVRHRGSVVLLPVPAIAGESAVSSDPEAELVVRRALARLTPAQQEAGEPRPPQPEHQLRRQQDQRQPHRRRDARNTARASLSRPISLTARRTVSVSPSLRNATSSGPASAPSASKRWRTLVSGGSSLLIAPGDCYDPFMARESERLLRGYNFLSEVDIFPVPRGPA